MSQKSNLAAALDLAKKLLQLPREQREVVMKAFDYAFCSYCGKLDSPDKVVRKGISRTVCNHPHNLQDAPRDFMGSVEATNKANEEIKSIALAISQEYFR